jgi:hypothetical protein
MADLGGHEKGQKRAQGESRRPARKSSRCPHKQMLTIYCWLRKMLPHLGALKTIRTFVCYINNALALLILQAAGGV